MTTKIISFKSIPEYWHKESLGLKRNTARKFRFEDKDPREKILKEYMAGLIDHLIIKIYNTVETQNYFKRETTDVSFWDGIYLISW